MTMLADLFRDFRYAARGLARTPGFTVVAVAVLALGIGATSAIFSLVSAVWLKSPTFADAERIVALPLIGSWLAAKVMPDDEEVWLRRPSGDPAAVGRTIALTGSPHWVVRDVPRDFDFPQGRMVLAPGIGATSAIFSLVSAVWLKPLPFADEERLVSLWVDVSSLGSSPTA